MSSSKMRPSPTDPATKKRKIVAEKKAAPCVGDKKSSEKPSIDAKKTEDKIAQKKILDFPSKREAKRWASNRAKFLSQKMAEYAARKQEKKVLQFLSCFKGEDEVKYGCRPTEHTWTTLINLYVKLGRIAEAETLFEEKILKEMGKPTIAAGCALLKGYWVEFPGRDPEKAEKLLDSLSPEHVNSRTLSTFFRGCLRWGAIEPALRRYEEWRNAGVVFGEKNAVVGFDYSSLEYLVQVCLSFKKVKTASQIYSEFEEKVLEGSKLRASNTGVYMRLKMAFARARLELGQKETAQTIVSNLKKIELDKEWNFWELFPDVSCEKKKKSSDTKETKPESSEKSLEQFQNHQKQEIRRDLETLEKLILQQNTAKASTTTSAFSRLLYSSPVGQGDDDSTVESKTWSTHFSQANKTVLELGAGNGEWALGAAKLLQDNGHLVVASELRHERCCKILQQSELSRDGGNLLILGGNAKQLLKNCFAESERFDFVMSNFPEPPQWHSVDAGKGGDLESQHLLTGDFLNSIVWRLVKDGGTLLVHGDNKVYLQSVAQSLSESKWMNESRETPVFAQLGELVDEKGASKGSGAKKSPLGITVQSGRPGEYRRVLEGSEATYFDTMWQAGGKKGRWFVRVTKTTPKEVTAKVKKSLKKQTTTTVRPTTSRKKTTVLKVKKSFSLNSKKKD